MKLNPKIILVTLAVAVAAGATIGVAFAAINREFDLPIVATVTVQIVSGGDVNGDGKVDSEDLEIVVAALGTSPPSDPRADVNGDNVVDIYDLAEVAQSLGVTLAARPVAPSTGLAHA